MTFRNRAAIFLAALTSFLSPLNAAAQQAASQVVPIVPASPVSFWGMMQVLFGLLVVLAAIAAIAWLLRRFPLGQNAMGGAVRVVGGVALGPRERLVLVEVGETWLLVGVAPGQVNALHTLPRPLDAPKGNVLPTEQGFATWLKQAIHKRSEN
jgi:flagellar protein FliO/FliZ